MLISLRALLAGAAFLVSSGPVLAESLSLSQAQQLAARRSQQLVASDAAAVAARETAAAAGQLPDPVLRIGVENVPLSGPERLSLGRDFMTMRRIGLAQELTRREKRELRSERAGREGERVQAERQGSLAELQRETALAWIERFYADAMVDLLRTQLGEAELQVRGSEVAFRGGRGSQADVFAARAAVVNLHDRLAVAERQAANARVMMARWIGPEAAAQPLAGTVNWGDPGVEQVLVPGHLQHHPQLLVLAAGVRAAETELRQAQAATRPDWTVEVMYSQRGSAYSDMVSVGASVPLQWDRPSRQNRDIAAKAAMLSEARARYEEAVRAEESMVRQMLNEWSSGRQRLERLSRELVAEARHRSDAALAAYRAGKGELATVLTARREEIDARMQILSLEMEVARAWARLRFLVPDNSLAPN